jgi:hypothetical protein
MHPSAVELGGGAPLGFVAQLARDAAVTASDGAELDLGIGPSVAHPVSALADDGDEVGGPTHDDDPSRAATMRTASAAHRRDDAETLWWEPVPKRLGEHVQEVRSRAAVEVVAPPAFVTEHDERVGRDGLRPGGSRCTAGAAFSLTCVVPRENDVNREGSFSPWFSSSASARGAPSTSKGLVVWSRPGVDMPWVTAGSQDAPACARGCWPQARGSRRRWARRSLHFDRLLAAGRMGHGSYR